MTPRPFSRAARRALRSAEAFAREHGEIERFPGTERALGYVTADHLLLGVAHPNTVTEIWNLLEQTQAEVHVLLARVLSTGEWPPPPSEVKLADRPHPVAIEPDATISRALSYATGEARRLGAAEIGPEHLLLGALRVGEPHGAVPESLGHLALVSLGITLPAVFEVLLNAEDKQSVP